MSVLRREPLPPPERHLAGLILAAPLMADTPFDLHRGGRGSSANGPALAVDAALGRRLRELAVLHSNIRSAFFCSQVNKASVRCLHLSPAAVQFTDVVFAMRCMAAVIHFAQSCHASSILRDGRDTMQKRNIEII